MKKSNFWKTIILTLSIISFVSCSNLFNDFEINNQNKAYLVIGSVEVNGARSINPPSDEEILNSFTNISLSGSGKDSNNKSISLSSVSAGSLKELYKKQILLDAGTWTFTLTAKIGTTDFISTVSEILIESGKDNSVSFTLEPKKDSNTNKVYGGLSVTINFKKTNDTKVAVTFYKTDDDDDDSNDEVIEAIDKSKTTIGYNLESTGLPNGKVTYSRAINYVSSRLEPGEYRLVFDFYSNDFYLNSLSYIVHIAGGITTTYTQTIDLNEIFTITYNGLDVTPSPYIAEGQTKVTKFSRKSEDIILPRYNRQNRIFEGWYDSEGNLVTVIPHNTNKNITVTARWRDLEENSTETLYVNPSAQYHLGTEELGVEYGLESLEAALETIERVHSYVNKHSWIIKIKGSISGSHAIESNSNNFNNYVQSITLEGSTGPDADGIPQDELNGGFTTSTENGAVLAVNTKVPVTIKNLKITGGNNTNTGNIKGGGIFVNSNAKVTLDDGALITGNSAPAGSGIYIASNGSVNGTLQMGGEAQVTSDNNVYLPSGSKLLITKSFEGNITHGATIIPETYEEDLQVLALASNASGSLDVEYSIFKVAPQVTGGITTNWLISAEGKLYPDETGNIYVGSNDNPESANGSKNNPFTTLAGALAKIEADGDSETEFTIFIDGAVSSDTETTIDIDSTKASKLTITGKTGTSSDSISGTLKCTPIIIDTAIPVSICNLTVTGGSGENGGGIIVNSGSLTIGDGALITRNTSSGNGAGIYVKESAELYLTGGTIQNNTLTGSSSYGAGIYCEYGGNVFASGAPVVDDLYFDGTIKLQDDLQSGTSITVTPYNYMGTHMESPELCDGTNIVRYADNDENPIGNNANYFHITPKNGSTTEWFVDEYGNLNCYFTVTLSGSGVTEGSTIKLPCCSGIEDLSDKVSANTGYVFQGWWYKDTSTNTMELFDFKQAEEEYYEYTLIENDMSLYATWAYITDSIYINTTSGADFISIDSENSVTYGDGSSTSPLKTINGAINMIKTINNATKDYTIIINGISEEKDITIDDTLPAKSITIQGASETNGFKRSSGSNKSIFKISTSKTVSFNNIKFSVYVSDNSNDGLAINIGNGANVILDNGTILQGTGNNSISAQGIIAIENGGSLVMNSGVQFTGFEVKHGVVYVKSGGSFTMNGGTFTENHSFDPIVYVEGTFTMEDGNITSNTQYLRYDRGCAVCVKSGGTFTMNSGTISNNICYAINSSSNAKNAGAGVFVSAGGTFNMTDGTISGNQALKKAVDTHGNVEDAPNSFAYGGGVCIEASGTSIGTFTMTGGTISSNTAGTSGNGIGFFGTPDAGTTGVITIGETAVISADNDIYLPDFMTIAVASQLTGNNSKPTITPENYGRTSPVLTVAQDAAEALVSEFSKFAVTANGSTTYTISELGELVAGTNSGNGGSSIPDDFVQVTGASITSAPIIVLDDDDHTQNTEGAFSAATTTNPITVSSFYMCEHEVTQAEYELYCIYGDTAPSETSNKDKYPVYNISWYDAIVYCNLRSMAELLTPVYSVKKAEGEGKSTDPATWVGIQKQGDGDEAKYCGPDEQTSAWDWVAASPGYDNIEINETANGYRLPTAMEWEYAGRGGNGLTGDQTMYSGSNNIEVVSFGDYSIHKIMQKSPNALQIYDMSGSVCEWLWDVYGEDWRGMSTLNDLINYSFGVEPYNRSSGSYKLGLRVVRNAQ